MKKLLLSALLSLGFLTLPFASAEAATTKDQAIRIVIKNNGPMIPAENVETIFEPFVTTKKLGTGIGLFVCKQIVEKHNGSIMCRSDNDWTEFQIAFQK